MRLRGAFRQACADLNAEECGLSDSTVPWIAFDPLVWNLHLRRRQLDMFDERQPRPRGA